ncbi:MAG: GNAT family N-acetyltransferase [Clostridiales bacterium]|jgi:hypothetical protein|nr:GNAT family N-acetyltransferase [Clostridiales bacterium]
MLSIVTIKEAEKWDNIVKSFEKYDVNYLSGYVRAFQLHGDGEPLLFYYDDGDSTKAMNVVLKRDIADAKPFKGKLPLNTWFDLSSPYGYGGFWIEGKGYEDVNNAYNSYCRDKGFVSEFVRFHLFSNYRPHFNGLSETLTHNIVRDLELPLDKMLMDFEHKVRKNIKKATKAGLEVEIDTSGKRIKDFLEIYYETMDRTNAKHNFFFSEEFFKVLNEMKGHYVYLHVLNEGTVISTELVLYGSENCYSFLGGTKRSYFHLRPNDFLKYQIIMWAKERGLKRFILGGGYGNDDGIFKYKKSFAPNGVHDFYIGKKILNQAKYDELVGIRIKEEDYNLNALFFPIYRA